MKTIEDMVRQEIMCRMSSLVLTLAQTGGCTVSGTRARKDDAALALSNLCDQAVELATPVLDYEEAAIQAGWSKCKQGAWINPAVGDAAYLDVTDLCGCEEIDPYEQEVSEYWVVSSWLVEKLAAQGERVDTDFAGLNVWARTASGQSIEMDGVIQRVYSDMMKVT